MKTKGAAAWKDVPDASKWVDELRGNEPGQTIADILQLLDYQDTRLLECEREIERLKANPLHGLNIVVSGDGRGGNSEP